MYRLSCSSILAFLAIPLLVGVLPLDASRDDESPCRYGNIAFDPDVDRFSSEISRDWESDYAEGQVFSEAYQICQRNLKAQGFNQKPYITECFFRSATDPDFSGMGVHARGGVVHRVRLHFKKGLRHTDVYEKLLASFGTAGREGEYFEEKWHHNLREWRFQNCRVVYVFGGMSDVVPVYLFFERLPEYKGGFNPLHIFLNHLKSLNNAR